MVLYRDNLIEITESGLLIKRYYFPFGGAKWVPWRDVDECEVVPNSFFRGRWHLWGSAGFNCWFPLDFMRPLRDRIFVLRHRKSVIRIGFTVENARRVEKLLRERRLLPA